MRLLARFLPPPDSSPRAIRVAAARNALFGAILVAFGIALVFALDGLTHGRLLEGTSKLRVVSGVPMLTGWVVIATSSWRFVVGVHPSREPKNVGRSVMRLAFMTAVLAASFSAIVFVASKICVLDPRTRQRITGKSENAESRLVCRCPAATSIRAAAKRVDARIGRSSGIFPRLPTSLLNSQRVIEARAR